MLSDNLFSSLLLICYNYTYAANAKSHILCGNTNLLESCFGGWIIYVLEGLSVAFEGLAPCPFAGK